MMDNNEFLYGIYASLEGVRYDVLGKSVLGREIRRYRFGENAKILLCAGVHAREWITVLLAVRLALKEKDACFDLIPCLNPDGTELAVNGISSVNDEKIRKNLIKVNGGEDFSLWKANARCVDVNVNFDADWGEGLKNVTSPAPGNYIGRYAGSEPETQAAVKALKKNYALVTCYHSLGEVVYWGYESNFRHYKEAKEYAEYLGYGLMRSEYSSGGMKDYYALNYDGLGLTAEVGEDVFGHPYPVDRLEDLEKKHEGSVKLLASLGERIYGRIHGSGSCRSGKSVQ